MEKMYEKKLSLITRLSTIIIIFLPILSIYKSFISKIDLGNLMLVVIFLLGIITLSTSKKRLIINKKILFIWLIYLIYILGITFYRKYFDNNNYSMLRMFKQILYISILLIESNTFLFNYWYALKIYLNICFFTSIFIIFQNILYYVFSFGLPGYITNFIFDSNYIWRAKNIGKGMFRPCSIFYEPAHYFEYVLIGLVICLFYGWKEKKFFWLGIIISIGILLSTSGQGLVCIFFIWITWILKDIGSKKNV